MYDIYHLFGKLCNFASLKCLEIFEFFWGNPIGIVHVSLVNDIFRSERIAHFFLKLLQNIWADWSGIAKPVYIFLSCKFIKYKSKLMEKCSKAHNIHILMSIQKSAQTFQGISFCFRLAHIKCNLRFHIFPVIYYCIVHVYRIPHDICQEAYSVFMKQLCSSDHYITGFFIIAPQLCWYRFPGSTVYNFPPSVDIISCIHRQHIRI